MKKELNQKLNIFIGFYEYRPINQILTTEPAKKITKEEFVTISKTLNDIELNIRTQRTYFLGQELDALKWYREKYESGKLVEDKEAADKLAAEEKAKADKEAADKLAAEEKAKTKAEKEAAEPVVEEKPKSKK